MKSKDYNILSLFDGMGCLYMSLIEAGFKVKKYYSSEIENIPIRFTKQNIPDVQHLGDIEKWKDWEIDWEQIDLIGAGSPCQGFSFAGKQLNFKDPRSRLFFVFVEILKHVKKLNPKVLFILENVNMKREYQRVINEILGIFPVRINSNLVSAQNRDRLYWTNIRTKKIGLFGELQSDIPLPIDKKIYLEDILQPVHEVDEKYYFKRKVNISIEEILEQMPGLIDRGEFKAMKNKASCLDYSYYKGIDNHAARVCICVTNIGRRLDENGTRKDYDSNIPYSRKTQINKNNKTNCLTSVLKDNYILQIGRGFNNSGFYKYKTPTITSNSWEQNNIIFSHDIEIDNEVFNIKYSLRKLTPKECLKLQTIPEWVNVDGFSDTAIYKMCGNGWTVEVIKHILSFINKN